MDSYQRFLSYFNISQDEFLEWGIDAIIYPPIDKVYKEWENLKKRIFGNEVVYIRGYGKNAHGTKLYQDLYSYIFRNNFVKKDANNNTIPTQRIRNMTGLKKNRDIYNYQISHIWGRTKNIFMFEAPWNILCYVPKIMDPFTGHESMGEMTKKYKKLFIDKAYTRYKYFIEDYNTMLAKYNVEEKVNTYIAYLKDSDISEKELSQFIKDVELEISPI